MADQTRRDETRRDETRRDRTAPLAHGRAIQMSRMGLRLVDYSGLSSLRVAVSRSFPSAWRIQRCLPHPPPAGPAGRGRTREERGWVCVYIYEYGCLPLAKSACVAYLSQRLQLVLDLVVVVGDHLAVEVDAQVGAGGRSAAQRRRRRGLDDTFTHSLTHSHIHSPCLEHVAQPLLRLAGVKLSRGDRVAEKDAGVRLGDDSPAA